HVDRQPRRRGRLADEARELDAADAVGADLLHGDAAAGDLLCEKVAGVAQPTAGDELALTVGARPWRHAQLGLAARDRGHGKRRHDDEGMDRAHHVAWRRSSYRTPRTDVSRGRGAWYRVTCL